MDYSPLLFDKRHRFISFLFCYVLCAFQLVTELKLKETVIFVLIATSEIGKGGGGG